MTDRHTQAIVAKIKEQDTEMQALLQELENLKKEHEQLRFRMESLILFMDIDENEMIHEPDKFKESLRQKLYPSSTPKKKTK